MVLVVVSAVLLLHNRTLPDSFGTVPGADHSSVAAAPASAAQAAAAVPGSVPVGPSTSAATTVIRTPSRSSAVPRRSGAGPTTTPSRTGTPRSTAPRTTTGTRTTTPVATASRTTAPVDPRVLPQQLLLPRFGVRADVLPVTSTDGTLAVPENPQQVGWWAGSALPGSPSGTTVIDGHIDSATAGVGALIHLSDLVPGDHVSIVGSTGRTLDYVVVARRVYVKHAGLPPSLFAPGGPERLLLISCGGPFDSARGSYEDNIAVFATPAAGRPPAG